MKIEVSIEEITELIRLIYTLKEKHYLLSEMNDDSRGELIAKAQTFLCSDLLECIESKERYEEVKKFVNDNLREYNGY